MQTLFLPDFPNKTISAAPIRLKLQTLFPHFIIRAISK
jgi:hypothetical protein